MKDHAKPIQDNHKTTNFLTNSISSRVIFLRPSFDEDGAAEAHHFFLPSPSIFCSNQNQLDYTSTHNKIFSHSKKRYVGFRKS